MSYPSDLTDEQWALLEPVFNTPDKRGPKHAPDLRRVVNAMLYISHTGCQWRYLPATFGPWTRVWSQFRRWSRNGTWARALAGLHEAAREADGRAEATPSMVVIDTHLARGASKGGFTFHDRGGPYGRTKGAKRVVAVDVTGLPVGALVVPASTHENRTTELMLQHLTEQGVTGRLELVLVDRGVTETAARELGRDHDLELRRVGWDDKQPVFRPIRHAWRVEVAHGSAVLGQPATKDARPARGLTAHWATRTSDGASWMGSPVTAATAKWNTRSKLRVSRRLAILLDDLVRIPGTKQGVGLDALLGLVPGFGDLLGSGISGAIMFGAVRNRVPVPLLAQMAWNLLLDAALGLVPLVGDLVDVAHRANVRNYRLLEKAVAANPHPGPPTVGYVLAALALTVLPLLVTVALGMLALVLLFRWVTS